MPNYLEKVYETTLPVVVLRDTVAFPAISSTFEVSDNASMSAADAATEGSSRVFLVAESTPTTGEPKISGLFKVAASWISSQSAPRRGSSAYLPKVRPARRR